MKFLLIAIIFTSCFKPRQEVKEANNWDGVSRIENDEVICYKYYTTRVTSGGAGAGISCKWKQDLR